MAQVSALVVARFLGQGDVPGCVALAEEHLPVVLAFVRAYTRGGGFIDGEPNDELAAVVTTVTARLVSNPSQARAEQMGDYSVSPAVFAGFSLAEQMVLNRYRRRAL